MSRLLADRVSVPAGCPAPVMCQFLNSKFKLIKIKNGSTAQGATFQVLKCYMRCVST